MNRSGKSKRTLSQIIKKERERLQQTLRSDEASNVPVPSNSDDNIGGRGMFIEEVPHIEAIPHAAEAESLRDKLKSWYLKYSPGMQAFDELLKILKLENIDVPISSKSIIGNLQEIVVKKVLTGEYWHCAIHNRLQKTTDVFETYNEIVLDIGIDGLPLYKSFSQSLLNVNNFRVFLIGTYLGKNKQNCLESYLNDFVVEVEDLLENGIKINGKSLKFLIRAFISDAPAKAFLRGTVSHTSLRYKVAKLSTK